ncbi:hypothetical protein RUND412_008621 [Rhizina undulata]
MSAPTPRSFEPKEPVQLAPPKDDPITAAQLAEYSGEPGKQVYVAIKGTVFDVTGNPSYAKGGKYNVFTGKDSSRALAKSSVNESDCVPEYEDLGEKEQQTLNEWYTYFSKRYNVVGRVIN